MALSSIIKHSHDGGTIAFADGTGTPLTLTVRFDKADFKVEGVSKDLREVVEYTGRSKTRSVRYGAPKYPTFSFSIDVADLSENGTGTVLDWIHKKTGTPFASRVNTLAIGEVDTFDITYTQEGTALGDGADQTIKIEDCYVESWNFNEGEPNTISLSGKVYGDVSLNGAVVATAPRAS